MAKTSCEASPKNPPLRSEGSQEAGGWTRKHMYHGAPKAAPTFQDRRLIKSKTDMCVCVSVCWSLFLGLIFAAKCSVHSLFPVFRNLVIGENSQTLQRTRGLCRLRATRLFPKGRKERKKEQTERHNTKNNKKETRKKECFFRTFPKNSSKKKNVYIHIITATSRQLYSELFRSSFVF